MPIYTDPLGRQVEIPTPPRRIISLVPSITELLHTLQLDQQVIGITKFCIHPAHWFQHKTRIGGTKNIHVDIVHQLQPDLIIANKEENVQDQVEALAQQYPVFTTDVNNLHDALQMIEQIGNITNTQAKALSLVQQIHTAFAAMPTPQRQYKTGYLIWQQPYMTIGGDTFIHDLLARCGFINQFGHHTRYPVVELAQLSTCELLLLSSEPFPFSQKHIDELQPHLPNTQIVVVDGEMFSWYGSHLLHAPAYFTGLLNSIT